MRTIPLLVCLGLLFAADLQAQVPQIINYQGRVQSGGVNFNGTGKFKFAIVIGTAPNPITSWSNDGTSAGGTEPTKAVSVPVANGVYSVLLGDTTLANMTAALPSSTFNFSSTLYLRVWFDDGVHGSQLLTPDQRIAPAAWSMVSGLVGNNGVTTNSITDAAVTTAKIAPVGLGNTGINATQIASKAISAGQIADGTITSGQIAARTIGEPQLGINSVTYNQLANDSVHSVTLLDNAVTGIKIANQTITPDKIALNSLTASQLAPNSVDYSELALNSVHHDIIGVGEVQTVNLANGAVDASKLGITTPTKINNLNADLLDGFHSTSFVLKAGDSMTGALNVTGGVNATSSAASGSAISGLTTNGGYSTGVFGKSTAGGIGVEGVSDDVSGWGVHGKSLYGLAGFFEGQVKVIGNIQVQVLTITGGADLAEPFKLTGKNIPKGSVMVIDESAPGNLMLSNQPYDHRVAGIVSGANGIAPGIQLHQEGVLDGDENVALSGRVYVRADTTNGAIKPGDLLTTSSAEGKAMRVSDYQRAQGAIVGKAMTSLSEGEGFVLVLVTLQ